MRIFLLLIILCLHTNLLSQSCIGNYKTISSDNFGTGSTFTGNQLGPGVTTYTFFDSPLIPCPASPLGFALNTLYDGFYTLTKNPYYNHTFGCRLPFRSNWIDDTDHTGNSGYMLLCNASGTPDVFYEKNYKVCENTTCKFSIWAANICKSSVSCIIPIVKIDVIDVSTGQIINSVNSSSSLISNSDTKLNWVEITANFKVPVGQDQIKIRISNLQSGNQGNDVVFDDISFSICVPKGNISGSTQTCINSPTTLNLNMQSGIYNNPEYLWQRSLDNITWINIPGSNSPTYTFTATQSCYYRVIYAENGNVNDSNCNGVSDIFYQNVSSYPPPIVSTPVLLCQNSITQSLTATGVDLQWYDASMIPLPSAPVPNTSSVGITKYYVSQGLGSCESTKSEIVVKVLTTPSAPIAQTTVKYCKNETATALIAAGSNLKWYNSLHQPLISAPIPDTSQIGVHTFYVTQSIGSCESPLTEIAVNIFDIPTPPQIPDQSICENKQVILDAGSGYDSYLWNTGESTQSIVASTIGTYYVKVFNVNGCFSTTNVNVNKGESPVINSIFNGENYIIISASGGNPPYEYSIDNKLTWQDSKRFDLLKPGKYTVFVRSKDTFCFAEGNTVILFIPNFISPNTDGINDVLKLENLDILEYAKLSIFDRYGKLIFENDKKSKYDWNGTYLGRTVPSDSYWYVIDLGNGQVRTGWIVVKNRN